MLQNQKGAKSLHSRPSTSAHPHRRRNKIPVNNKNKRHITTRYKSHNKSLATEPISISHKAPFSSTPASVIDDTDLTNNNYDSNSTGNINKNNDNGNNNPPPTFNDFTPCYAEAAEAIQEFNGKPFTWISSRKFVDQWDDNVKGFQDKLKRAHNPKTSTKTLTVEDKRLISEQILAQEDPRPSVYIDTPEALRILHKILQLDPESYIGMDLEFGQQSAFMPTLELMQLSTQYGIVAIIDVAALSGHMLPMIKLFNGRELIMHGSNQDLQMLFNLRYQYDIPCTPKRVHDTQIMAGFIGLMPPQIGLANLIKHHLHFVLPKGLAQSDWSTRPLTTNQVKYAFEDVRYLHHVFDLVNLDIKKSPHIHIPAQLVAGTQLNIAGIVAPILGDDEGEGDDSNNNNNNDNGNNKQLTQVFKRRDILNDALDDFILKSQEESSPENAWLNVAADNVEFDQLTPIQQEAVKVLAKWRQINGYRRNQRPGLLVKDQTLLYLAQHQPTEEEIKKQFNYMPFVKANAAIIRNLLTAVFETKSVKPVITATTSEEKHEEDNVLTRKRMKRTRLATTTHNRCFASLLALVENVAEQVSINSEVLCPQGQLRHIVILLLDEIDKQQIAIDESKAEGRELEKLKAEIDLENLPPGLRNLPVFNGFRKATIGAPIVAFINGASLTLSL